MGKQRQQGQQRLQQRHRRHRRPGGAVALTATVAAAALALVGGCGAVTGDSAPSPLVIAADLELTGEGSALGAVYRNALQLRVDQVNQQGLLGDRRLELEVRDNRSDAGTAGLNVAELAADSRVTAIITGGCSECAMAGVEAANEHGVPLISLAAATAVTEPVAERRFVFKLGPNADDSAAALVAELGRAGVTSIGLVATADAYGADGVREMTSALDRAGITLGVVAEVTTETDTLATAAADIVAYQPEPADPPPGEPADTPVGPDAVVVWTPAWIAGELATAIRAADYQGQLFLESAAVDELFLTGPAGEALSDAILIFNESLVMDTVIATSPAKVARKTWFNSYSARYGTYHGLSAFAVDAVDVLVTAAGRLDSVNPGEIRDAFERTRIDGIAGPIRITPDNHSGLTSLSLIPLVAAGDRWQPAA